MTMNSHDDDDFNTKKPLTFEIKKVFVPYSTDGYKHFGPGYGAFLTETEARWAIRENCMATVDKEDAIIFNDGTVYLLKNVTKFNINENRVEAEKNAKANVLSKLSQSDIELLAKHGLKL